MKQRTCLITGASRGLGKYLAKFFSDRGYNLILVSSNQDKLFQVHEELRLDSNQINMIVTDLSVEGFEKDMFKQIKKIDCSIDLLINNAAIQGPIGPFIDVPYDEWLKVFRINFLAATIISSKTIELMDDSGGSIINLSGGGAAGLRTKFSAYASSKTALVRFSETLASELIEKKINVNAIAPGPMATDMMKEVTLLSPKEVGEKEFSQAEKVLSKKDDMSIVGELCYFLCNEGKNITGKLISAKWDNWKSWVDNLDELNKTDLYTLRRVVGRDRGIDWGDK